MYKVMEDMTADKVDGDDDNEINNFTARASFSGGISDSENELHTDPLDTYKNDNDKKAKALKPVMSGKESQNKESSTSINSLDSNEAQGGLFIKVPKTDLIKQDSFSNTIISPSAFNNSNDVDKHKIRQRDSRTISDPVIERTPHVENDHISPVTGPTPYKKSLSVPNDDKKEKNSIANKFKSIASFATITKWWQNNVDQKILKRKEKIEEQKMRVKLQYHFMTPYQKYKLGRKPWKLCVQILKILIVTTQVKT